MGKSHLFRILFIAVALLLLTIYFIVYPAENTATLSNKKRDINNGIEPVYVNLDTLQTIHLKYK